MKENRFRTEQEEPLQAEKAASELDSLGKSTEESPAKEDGKKKRRKREKKNREGLRSVLGGSFLIKEEFTKQFPFMVYITLLLMILITNTYVAEERNREIAKTTKTLNDLHVEYIQLKSAIMQASKQSVLARRLEKYGIKETYEPLKRIVVSSNEKATAIDTATDTIQQAEKE